VARGRPKALNVDPTVGRLTMMLTQGVALVSAAILAMVCLFRAHRLLDVSCMGAFVLSHLIMAVAGLLAAPWLLSTYYRASFPYIRWDLITDGDQIRATTVIVGGLLLAILGDALADQAVLATGGRPLRRWGGLLSLPPATRLGVPVSRTVVMCVLLAAAAAAMFATRWSDFRTGLTTGYLAREIATQFSAREAIQQLGRPYYLVALSALPFTAVLLWMIARFNGRRGLRFLAAGAVALTAFFLFATFEKRPLALFAITFLTAEVTIRLKQRPPAVAVTPWFRRIPTRWLWTIALVPLGMLLGFYYLSTNLAEEVGLGTDLIRGLALIVLLRLVGRLSILPLLYAHYYPLVHPHYGLSNVGVFSAVAGEPVYRDTIEVWHYFTGADSGTGAVGALMDSWAAYGWAGWATAAVLLGAAMNWLDRRLAALSPTVLNRCFYLFMIVVASTLSQASVTRCLSTYGGLVFVSLWVLFRLDLVRQTTRPRHVSEAAT